MLLWCVLVTASIIRVVNPAASCDSGGPTNGKCERIKQQRYQIRGVKTVPMFVAVAQERNARRAESTQHKVQFEYDHSLQTSGLREPAEQDQYPKLREVHIPLVDSNEPYRSKSDSERQRARFAHFNPYPFAHPRVRAVKMVEPQERTTMPTASANVTFGPAIREKKSPAENSGGSADNSSEDSNVQLSTGDKLPKIQIDEKNLKTPQNLQPVKTSQEAILAEHFGLFRPEGAGEILRDQPHFNTQPKYSQGVQSPSPASIPLPLPQAGRPANPYAQSVPAPLPSTSVDKQSLEIMNGYRQPAGALRPPEPTHTPPHVPSHIAPPAVEQNTQPSTATVDNYQAPEGAKHDEKRANPTAAVHSLTKQTERVQAASMHDEQKREAESDGEGRGGVIEDDGGITELLANHGAKGEKVDEGIDDEENVNGFEEGTGLGSEKDDKEDANHKVSEIISNMDTKKKSKKAKTSKIPADENKWAVAGEKNGEDEDDDEADDKENADVLDDVTDPAAEVHTDADKSDVNTKEKTNKESSIEDDSKETKTEDMAVENSGAVLASGAGQQQVSVSGSSRTIAGGGTLSSGPSGRIRGEARMHHTPDSVNSKAEGILRSKDTTKETSISKNQKKVVKGGKKKNNEEYEKERSSSEESEEDEEETEDKEDKDEEEEEEKPNKEKTSEEEDKPRKKEKTKSGKKKEKKESEENKGDEEEENEKKKPKAKSSKQSEKKEKKGKGKKGEKGDEEEKGDEDKEEKSSKGGKKKNKKKGKKEEEEEEENEEITIGGDASNAHGDDVKASRKEAPNAKYYYPPKQKVPLSTCFYNPSGYVCCNLKLNNIVEKTLHTLKSDPNYSPCNINKISKQIQEVTEDEFEHPFENVVSLSDFAQNVHFAGDLACKMEIDGKYVLVYGTPFDAEHAKDADQEIMPNEEDSEETKRRKRVLRKRKILPTTTFRM